MNEPRLPSAAPASTEQDRAPRPAYEPPRVTRKKAVSRATLFSGQVGPPSSPPPLVSNG